MPPAAPQRAARLRFGGPLGFLCVLVDLEAELQRALECPGVALQVRDNDAMAPSAFDADIDKRHWAPDQIGVRQAQLLVDRRTTGGADEGRDVAVIDAEINGRTQCRRPPVLVAGFGAPGEDRLGQYRRVVERAVSAEGRAAVGGVDRLPGERATEIGRDANVVRDAVAETVAATGAPGQIVLAPGKEIAGNRAAIARE